MKRALLFLCCLWAWSVLGADQLHINFGNEANDQTGDSIRTGFMKTEFNFTELFNRVERGTNLAAAGAPGSLLFNGTNFIAGDPALLWNPITKVLSLGPGAMLALTNGWQGPINVRLCGAQLDGITDDTISIQNAFNAAAAQSNAVFFPPGNALVGKLTVPKGLRGIIGSCVPGVKAGIQLQTQLCLRPGANSPILYIPPGSYCSILSMGFDGRRYDQTIPAPLLKADVEDNTGGIRNETYIHGCSFHHSSGDGLEINRTEVRIVCTFACWNGGHGINYRDGSVDNSMEETGFGVNDGDGIHLTGNVGAMRARHVDAWCNHGSGMVIDGGTGVGDMRFEALQFNNNFQNSMRISNIVARVTFTDCMFSTANFQNDLQSPPYPNIATNGQYAEISIAPSAYSLNFSLVNCSIGIPAGYTPTLHPSYAIQDLRTNFPPGTGISIIGGIIAGPANFASGQEIYPPSFVTNATILVNANDAANYRLGPGNLGAGPASIGGPLTLTANGNTRIYQNEAGSFAVEVNDTGGTGPHYMLLSAKGNLALPKGLSTLDNITNGGTKLYFMGGAVGTNAPPTNGVTMLYQGPNGGFGIAGNYNLVSNTAASFFLFDVNGVGLLPRGLHMFGRSDTPTVEEVGVNGSMFWLSNVGGFGATPPVAYITYSGDGTNLFTHPWQADATTRRR